MGDPLQAKESINVRFQDNEASNKVKLYTWDLVVIGPHFERALKQNLGAASNFLGNDMSLPGVMPFAVEFGDLDVSRLPLLHLRRDLNGSIGDDVAYLWHYVAVNVRDVNEDLVDDLDGVLWV